MKNTLLVICTLLAPAMAQVDPAQPPLVAAADSRAPVTAGRSTPQLHTGALHQNPFRRLAADQKTFWTSGSDLWHGGARTFTPFAVFTGALVASDSWLSRQVPSSPQQLRRSREASQAATFALAGLAGGSFLLGRARGNDRLAESGLLSSEAMLNSAAITFAVKAATQRQRPLDSAGHGKFFAGGSSFPSQHATLAWSAASVFAHEYPGLPAKLFAYGLASAVTMTRVTAREHFASDAVVGSALGWYVGRQVYRAHHRAELGGAEWNGLRAHEGRRNPENMSSPPVPLDSWVYPAMERLAAFGYLPSAHLGMRPWTRLECARLLDEARPSATNDALPGSEAQRIFRALNAEFASETAQRQGAANTEATIASLYTRATAIAGPPLRDGYHFGQTFTNDYGRPYAQGWNSVTGVDARATAGPFSVFARAEYQHAPAFPSAPPSALSAAAQADITQPLPDGRSAIDRFRLLEGAAAFTFRNLQLSFGKQGLWLGPGESGPFLLSDNAEPVPMLRMEQVSPVRVPLLSRILGPMGSEFFLGQLSGHRWVFSDGKLVGPEVGTQPFIHGNKLSFKPTPNLEFGMGFTVLFGGPGLPFTWRNFARTFTSFNVAPGSVHDPGDRRSTFDFSYRVPGLRHWLTVYADSLVDDEFSPIGSTRPSLRMGMYFSHLPRLPRLDLRLEGLYTDVPGQKPGGFLYWNGRYRSGYTNDGALLASWIGRQGKGGEGWATYWLSPRSKIQMHYRQAVVDKAFIGGGRAQDFGLRGEFLLRPQLAVSGGAQFEQWRFPALAASGRSNVSTSLQLTYYPGWTLKR